MDINTFFLFLCKSGINEANEEELKQIASTPYSTHVVTVSSIDLIKTVQKDLIARVCSGVEDQINSLASGEEGKKFEQLNKVTTCSYYLF